MFRPLVRWTRWVIGSKDSASDEAATPEAIERAARNLSTKQQIARERQRVNQLTEIVRTMARQLNHNTVTMRRWSIESPELFAIERKAYFKAKRAAAKAAGEPEPTDADDPSALVVPDRRIIVVS